MPSHSYVDVEIEFDVVAVVVVGDVESSLSTVLV
jgi:hypothetical protein